jgi:predicted nucleic acid-binding protein
MKGIADTGLIVAFGNRGDRHHAWAVELARSITEPLLTCEAVLAEAVFHLGSSPMFCLSWKTRCYALLSIAAAMWKSSGNWPAVMRTAVPIWLICA